MIKGVHQLTLSPKTLISLIDHFTIFNGWMDSRANPCADPEFLSGEGVQARRPEYRIRTWDQYIRTHAYMYCMHTGTLTHTHTYIHTHVQTGTRMSMHRQTDRHTCTSIDCKLKYIQIYRNCIISVVPRARHCVIPAILRSVSLKNASSAGLRAHPKKFDFSLFKLCFRI